jgi:hypothetical protein
VIDDRSGIENRRIMMEDGRQREWTFSPRIFAATELRHLIERRGFPDVAVYGRPTGAPYHEQAERLIPVGRTRP